MKLLNKNKILVGALSVALVIVILFSSLTYVSLQSEIKELKTTNSELTKTSDNAKIELRDLGDLAKLSWQIIPKDDSWVFIKTQQSNDHEGKMLNMFVDIYTNSSNYGAVLRFPSLNITSPMYLGDDM